MMKRKVKMKKPPKKLIAVSGVNPIRGREGPQRTYASNGVKKRVLKRRRTAGATALIRSGENPIISPRLENEWESWQTFNPGVIWLDGNVHFLYRAVGRDGISRLGYAVSKDGFTINDRLPNPVYEHRTGDRRFIIYSYFSGGSFGGAEDPRLIRVDDEDVLYMTYTACDNGLRIGLTSIKVDDFINKKWKWRPPMLISPPDEVHKNWLIFPEKINGQYAILHGINPKIEVEYRDNLDFDDTNYIRSHHSHCARNPIKECWDKWLRGSGAPPLKTRDGWLLFYHAMDNDWSKYKVGAMLLDLNDPTKILYRAKEPILEPEEIYENNGYKPGIVYISGAVIKDGDLLVYYGCSDSHVSVAYANLDAFLEALKKEAKPKLKVKTLKKNKK